MSRKYKPLKFRPKNLLKGPLALDRMFDQVVKEAYDVAAPPVLYHYTNWVGALGILSEQKFWATAHDSLKDSAELHSADNIIMEVARRVLKNATGAPAEALKWFLNSYSSLHIGKLRTVCLICFSIARDDPEQWRRYGDNGGGICLGIKILNEPPPTNPPGGLIKVDYCESSWRDSINENFQKICSALSSAEVSSHNCHLGLNALYRIAAFASIAAKQPGWAVEQEFRRATLVAENDQHTLKERISGGRGFRYLPVSVRTEGKRIALEEIIIGPNQNADDASERLTAFIAANGYVTADLEYPKLVVSQVPPWNLPPILH